MRERPSIRFKDIPIFVKIGVLVAFFALPLPFFIFVAMAALYYAFYISVKKTVLENPDILETTPIPAPPAPKPWDKPSTVWDNDITLETHQRPLKTPTSTDVVCPQCGNKFYKGKPQICHLSNCYYD